MKITLSQVNNKIMPFGVHKDQFISDIDTEYLKWVIENVDNLSNQLSQYIQEELISRGEY